ncbi:hypothetical protein [Cellulosimicrobium sp. JZ28]|uniref:hypothetical protein n=1 Tax=Cellulosimicrobium sp. JZ28 TaxID=1906273 RepID=UPI001889DC52|nr:hypothetical protein [Cellulosimicrobium sp. JZ28]
MIEQRTPPQPRMGVVTAFDASTVTVDFGGGPTPGLLRDVAYSPIVGDRVLVMPTDSSWVVVAPVGTRGDLPAPTRPPEDVTVTVRTVNRWRKSRRANYGDRRWYYLSSGFQDYRQGWGPVAYPTAEDTPDRIDEHATLLHYGPLASHIPSGATILSVALDLVRAPGGSPLIAPTVWGHGYSAANPPTAGDPPVWVAGFGPVHYPRVAADETIRLTLPSAFVRAWLAGQITGIGLFPTVVIDYAEFTGPAPGLGDLHVTYTPPA